MSGSINDICLRTESVDSGSSSPKRSTNGCALVVLQMKKVEKRNEGLDFCRFRSPYMAHEMKTGELM